MYIYVYIYNPPTLLRCRIGALSKATRVTGPVLGGASLAGRCAPAPSSALEARPAPPPPPRRQPTPVHIVCKTPCHAP